MTGTREGLVETAQGLVRGQKTGAVWSWMGLPFAEPPVGPLRFRAPQPPRPWTGVREASRAAATALQPGTFPEPLDGLLNQRSEDCLFLNVWSPAADGRKRPVVVWIHGGSYETGSGDAYRGHLLAEQGDIVFVSINYRLGALAFLNLRGLFDDERFDANVGLLDQVAALRWVKENIAAFGGDPERVTIAGESAGSGSVVSLMVMEAARGLFHGAISQSAGLTLTTDWEDSLRIAQEFAGQLGVGRDTRERLWQLPASHLLRAMHATKKTRPEGFMTRPYFDGQVLPASLEEAYARPTPNVPLLIGSNLDEHRYFTVLRVPVLPLTRARLANTLMIRLGAQAADELLRLYPDDARGLTDLGSDLSFTMPGIHFSERHVRHAPVWRYRLDYPSPLFKLGAMHALDLFLLFPYPALISRLLLGRATPELKALQQRFQQHWLHFVREGRPRDDWPAYELEKRQTLLFNLSDQVVSDPHGERRRAWAGRDAPVR